MIEGLRGTNRTLRKACRFRRGIRVKRGTFDVAATRPKSRAEHFVRIRFPRDRVRPGPFRRPPSREARGRQIKAPPEKMHWAGFSNEPCTKFFEHCSAAHKNAPEAIDVFGIV